MKHKKSISVSNKVSRMDLQYEHSREVAQYIVPPYYISGRKEPELVGLFEQYHR